MKQESRLPGIDILRGVAIIMVIAVHQSLQFPGLSDPVREAARYGQMGVQLFFVLSAYTLCVSYEGYEKDRLTVLRFYIRRYFRIAPLYYCGILLYFLYEFMKAHLGIGEAVRQDVPGIFDIVANILFIHGFIPSANNNVVAGGWSIGTEMAFYIIFPALFGFMKNQYAAGRDSRMVIIIGGALAADLSAQLLAARISGAPLENNSFMYFNLVNQLPVFLIGITAFLSMRQRGDMRHANRGTVGNTALFVLFLALSFAVYLSGSGLPLAFLPFIAGVAFFHLLKATLNLPLRHGVLHSIGRVSYSMYIFHFIIAKCLTKFIVKFNAFIYFPADVQFLLCLMVSVCLTYWVALFTERHIENVGIGWGKRIIAALQSPRGEIVKPLRENAAARGFPQ